MKYSGIKGQLSSYASTFLISSSILPAGGLRAVLRAAFLALFSVFDKVTEYEGGKIGSSGAIAGSGFEAMLSKSKENERR